MSTPTISADLVMHHVDRSTLIESVVGEAALAELGSLGWPVERGSRIVADSTALGWPDLTRLMPGIKGFRRYADGSEVSQ